MDSDYELPISRASAPSALRITDLRTMSLSGVPFRSTLIRIDTNQGISGYGEVRDGASKTYALLLKSRILGENPCNVERIFRKLRQFGHHARQAGGVSAVEMALLDLAGRAYGVPVYALLGGRYRERILCYADTPEASSPAELAARLRERRAAGFAFVKMDVGVELLRGVPGALVAPPGALDSTAVMHPFTGVQVTAKGVDRLAEFVAAARDAVGDGIPLAMDHVGHVSLDSCIRIGQAVEPYTLAWLEDLLPWQLTDRWRDLTAAITTPTCTGEDIYLADGFRPLLDAGAVRVVHPDPVTVGGVLETKRLGDLAERYGVPMALHLAASPVATLAAVHAAAATSNFLALEHHAADVAGWSGIVTGLPQPLIQGGTIAVPDGPGLGFDGLDLDACRSFLDPADPGVFEPTAGWDGERSHDRLWS